MPKTKKLLGIVILMIFVMWPICVLGQEDNLFNTISNQTSSQTTKAIVTSFFFVGSFFVMGIYMILLFIQNKKQDYLFYSLYLLVFTYYFFLRIDDVLQFDLFGGSYTVHQHLLTPLLLVITSIYVRFINLFAEINEFDKAFSKRLNVFCILLLITAGSMVIYTLITKDFEGIRQNRSYFTLPMHVYTLLALIRAFRIIKTRIRHYILWSNIFLFTFSIIGVYWANSLPGRETIHSNSLFGFYAFNASQLGIFLEMICFSLGLGYKFGLIEKEKDEVKEKYIQELKKNEEVSRQLNEELTELVKERTREIENKNELLKKEQELKSTFFTNISHEFRTPITLISSPVQDLLKAGDLKKSSKESLEMIGRNSKKLLSLVEQLLDISKLDAGSMQLKLEIGDIQSFMANLIEPFAYMANQKGIQFETETGFKQTYLWFDKGILEKVVTNLLSNALKYTPANGSIFCETKVAGARFGFEVRNTGKGLSSEELERVFDRFYRTNDNGVPGTGIGLALVKDLVDLNKGSITVESAKNDWTVFRVSIPIVKEVYETSDFSAQSQPIENGYGQIENFADDRLENKTESELPHILVVDDNKDVRKYLGNLLHEKYNILTAKNGKEGLKAAKLESPDLILSDVMMPVMDGMELSQKLKEDIQTSHIPIVLLTARAGEENVLEGIQLGVDDYITKPFKNEFLLAKIDSMLANRNRVKDHYNKANGLKPKNLVFNNVEEKFFTKLQEVIDENLQNASFNVENFCAHVGMSRMQLHRKLRATLGVSASEFLNNERLKSAKRLLEESSLTISEIAYLSGFNSPNYFAKNFKKRFNFTPSDYRKTLESK